MTLAAFQQLSYFQRTKALEKAVCLRGRKDGEHLVLLYQLEGFYLQVYYHRMWRQVVSVNAFDDPALLDPYLENMQVRLPL